MCDATDGTTSRAHVTRLLARSSDDTILTFRCLRGSSVDVERRRSCTALSLTASRLGSWPRVMRSDRHKTAGEVGQATVTLSAPDRAVTSLI
eukprot:g19619.t1